MTSVVNKIMGGGQGKAQRRALELQQKSIDQQAAIQRREQIDADRQAEESGLTLSQQRRATAARARSRGGLQFTGPSTSLKNIFGG